MNAIPQQATLVDQPLEQQLLAFVPVVAQVNERTSAAVDQDMAD